MITTRYGKRALRVKTMPYYKELPVRFYEADPDHSETRARASVRASDGGAIGKAATAARFWAKQTSGKIRKNIGDPDPTDISLKDAKALFGLAGNYSRAQIDQRRDALRPAASTSPVMLAAVDTAYELLNQNLRGKV